MIGKFRRTEVAWRLDKVKVNVAVIPGTFMVGTGLGSFVVACVVALVAQVQLLILRIMPSHDTLVTLDFVFIWHGHVVWLWQPHRWRAKQGPKRRFGKPF